MSLVNYTIPQLEKEITERKALQKTKIDLYLSSKIKKTYKKVYRNLPKLKIQYKNILNIVFHFRVDGNDVVIDREMTAYEIIFTKDRLIKLLVQTINEGCFSPDYLVEALDNESRKKIRQHIEALQKKICKFDDEIATLTKQIGVEEVALWTRLNANYE